MFFFLLPLLAGFAFNSLSAFTTFFSTQLGPRLGRLACILFRNVLGIPVWTVGYAMAVLGNSPTLFTPSFLTLVFAWLYVLAGAVIIIIGMVSIRWRAAAPSVSDPLVQSGLYAHIRHPLYLGMILELVGLFLWVPQLTVLVACLLGVLWALLQARLEERDLLQRLPAYKVYMQRVPRFIPRWRG